MISKDFLAGGGVKRGINLVLDYYFPIPKSSLKEECDEMSFGPV